MVCVCGTLVEDMYVANWLAHWLNILHVSIYGGMMKETSERSRVRTTSLIPVVVLEF